MESLLMAGNCMSPDVSRMSTWINCENKFSVILNLRTRMGWQLPSKLPILNHILDCEDPQLSADICHNMFYSKISGQCSFCQRQHRREGQDEFFQNLTSLSIELFTFTHERRKTDVREFLRLKCARVVQLFTHSRHIWIVNMIIIFRKSSQYILFFPFVIFRC